VSHAKYELGVYIPEDDILHSHRRENPQILHRLGCLYVIQRLDYVVRGKYMLN
jgi:hypothetical protein